MKRTLFIIVAFVLYVVVSCVDPYNPPEIESATNFLVVDGLVDLADPDSRIKLTRSQNLSEEGLPLPESGAQVTVEVVNGPVYSLPEIAPGEYGVSGVGVSDGEKCMLRIRTASGEEYLSDVVTSKVSPPIDSVTFSVKGPTVEFAVTTHDPEGDSRYYRWKTVETVKYHSVHYSGLIWDATLQDVRPRTPEENIYYCWKTTPFSNIEVFSTKGLVEDAVRKQRVFSMPANSWKLLLRYSLHVRQYVMDQDEFNFWSELQKNTESIGTIFDPQPTQVTGNISSVNASGRKALGYFSIGRSAEERIFMGAPDLPPPEGGYQRPFPTCFPLDYDTLEIPDYLASNKSALLLNAVMFGPILLGYTTAERPCVDCRIIHGGTNVEPDFWE